MVLLFGQNYKREQLFKRIGRLSQIGGIERLRLEQGPQKGVEALLVRTGSGFSFMALPDRGLDIYWAEYKGQSLCWHSPTGPVSPCHYNPKNKEWLKLFYGGLVLTCGLSYAGAPCEDEGEKLGLHGPYTALEAEDVGTQHIWQGDECLLKITGQVRETAVFGPNILVAREIQAWLGQSKLIIKDTITNEGWETSPLMLLYHCNFGFPLIDEEVNLNFPSSQVIGRESKQVVAKEQYTRFLKPTTGFIEEVYYHTMTPDGQGLVTVELTNSKLKGSPATQGLTAYLRYRQKELPRFVQWKMAGEGTYVLGLEPANCWVEGRDKERERGTLQFLEPGSSVTTYLEIGICQDFQGS